MKCCRVVWGFVLEDVVVLWCCGVCGMLYAAWGVLCVVVCGYVGVVWCGVVLESSVVLFCYF